LDWHRLISILLFMPSEGLAVLSLFSKIIKFHNINSFNKFNAIKLIILKMWIG
jgi:hypothetical protein